MNHFTDLTKFAEFTASGIYKCLISHLELLALIRKFLEEKLASVNLAGVV